jgi:CRP/FNR family transcriptional regulator
MAMITSEIKLISVFPFFRGLSSSQLDQVRTFLFRKSFLGGETIINEGDEVEALYLIISGVAKVFKTSSEGKELILWIVKPGDSLNDIPILQEGNSLTSAIALEPTVVYGITKSHMRLLAESYPAIAQNIVRVMENRVKYLISLVDDLHFKPVTQRIIKQILEYAETSGANPTRFTQQQMAARAGTVREIVNRCLKTLEAQGLISIERHRIIILDKQRLKEMLQW